MVSARAMTTRRAQILIVLGALSVGCGSKSPLSEPVPGRSADALWCAAGEAPVTLAWFASSFDRAVLVANGDWLYVLRPTAGVIERVHKSGGPSVALAVDLSGAEHLAVAAGDVYFDERDGSDDDDPVDDPCLVASPSARREFSADLRADRVAE